MGDRSPHPVWLMIAAANPLAVESSSKIALDYIPGNVIIFSGMFIDLVGLSRSSFIL
jgi:hypothetical protein